MLQGKLYLFMATIINNPGETVADNSSSTGVLIGVLLAVLIALVLLAFGLPYLRNRGTGAPVAPATSGVSGSLNLQGSTGGGTGGASGSANGTSQ